MGITRLVATPDAAAAAAADRSGAMGVASPCSLRTASSFAPRQKTLGHGSFTWISPCRIRRHGTHKQSDWQRRSDSSREIFGQSRLGRVAKPGLLFKAAFPIETACACFQAV